MEQCTIGHWMKIRPVDIIGNRNIRIWHLCSRSCGTCSGFQGENLLQLQVSKHSLPHACSFANTRPRSSLFKLAALLAWTILLYQTAIAIHTQEEEPSRSTMPTTTIAAKEVEKVVTADEEITDIIVQRVPYWDPPAVRALDTSELTTWSLYRALIGEFTASLVLLYVSIATVIGYRNQSSAADQRCTGVGYLGVAWSFGATVSILVYSTSGVSGGHINPAVTFALFIAGKVTLVRSVLYVAAQCLGAVVGVGIVKGIMKHPYDDLGGGANVVAGGYSLGAALGAETFGTFVLAYTVFSATDPKRTARDAFVPLVAALPIGLAVFVVHLATIPITGTGINPARSLGAAVLYNQHKTWKQHWIFWVGPFTGAALAAFYHKIVLRDGAVVKESLAMGSLKRNSSTA